MEKQKLAYFRGSKNLIEISVEEFESLIFTAIQNNKHQFNERDKVYVYLHNDHLGVSIQVPKRNEKEHDKDFIGRFDLANFYSSSKDGRMAFYANLQNLMREKNANRS